MSMKSKQLNVKSIFMLFLTAFIWGVAFVAQSVGMQYIGPFTFSCARFFIGAIVLIPCIRFLDQRNEKNEGVSHRELDQKTLLIGGILCGIALFVAANFQQYGVKHTTVGKAGFITALYIVLVPICGLFLKKTVGIKVWISVLIAIAGLYFLCITESIQIGRGDFMVLISSFCFTIHIMLIDYFSPKTDGVRLSCIQFFVAGTLSLLPMYLFERPGITVILAAAAPILYAGVLSCGVAYTLQVVAQKDVDPTIASLVLSMESVFSVLAGWMFLKQVLRPREILGCVLMFTAIILAQLPDKQKVE